MRIRQATVPSNVDIVLWGDTHDGSRLATQDGINECIEFVSKKNRRWVHMGDAIEAIAVDDKRFDVESNEQPIPLLQAEAWWKRIQPAAKTGLGMLQGNHEFALHRIGDMTKLMAEQAGVPYLGNTCVLHLKDQHGPLFKMFLCHPSRITLRSNAKDWEQQQANMKASIKMRLKDQVCDALVMAMGHVHHLMIVEPPQRLVVKSDKDRLHQKYLGQGEGAAEYIEPDQRYYLATGSFLRTYGDECEGYAERILCKPVELGYIVIEVRDRQIARVSKRLVG